MANERLRELRTLMKVRNVDAYYVPSSDFHDSEYVEDYFKCRAFLSGFTGSAGTMVITQAFSGMWTDGRYFVQAKKELEGQDTRLMAMGEEGVPTIEEYLMDHMPEGGVLVGSYAAGSWKQSADGRWWWDYGDGTWAAAEWLYISGKWYYFREDGYMATGWITLYNKSYYLDPVSGAMYKSVRTPDGLYVNESGVYVPGM